MMVKKIWAQFWDDRIKQRKKENCAKGLSFLKSYIMKDATLVLEDLYNGLEMTLAENSNSAYNVIMPNNEKSYIRLRLSNHPSESDEWSINEIDGLPNMRYSIFIYNEKTCPQLASKTETEWQTYYSDDIPIHEKGFNERSLDKTFPKLMRILLQIYNGEMPQPTNML